MVSCTLPATGQGRASMKSCKSFQSSTLRGTRRAWLHQRLQSAGPWRILMRFARVTFFFAGAWGVLVLVPLYFALDLIGKKNPPAVTHSEFYYGFIGVAVAWQVAFFVIGRDPIRFRT